MQFACEQTLCTFGIDAIAKVQQFQSLRLEVFGIWFQFIVNFRIQIVFGRFMGHRLVQFTRNQWFGQRFFTVRPHQCGHFLALCQHRPNQQFVERKFKQCHFRCEWQQTGHQTHWVGTGMPLKCRRFSVRVHVAVHHFGINRTKFSSRVIRTEMNGEWMRLVGDCRRLSSNDSWKWFRVNVSSELNRAQHSPISTSH